MAVRNEKQNGTISKRICDCILIYMWNSLQFKSKTAFIGICFAFVLIVLNVSSQLKVIWSAPDLSVKQIQGPPLWKRNEIVSYARFDLTHNKQLHSPGTYKSQIVDSTNPAIENKTRRDSVLNAIVYSNDNALMNITKPWFSVFEQDKYLESEMHFFKRRKTQITNLPNNYSINVPLLCKNGSPSLLIMVPSIVNDIGIRKDIRTTWALNLYDPKTWFQNQQARIVFVFGDSNLNDISKQTLKSESLEFGDILTINMEDSYQNLSFKIASMMLWSRTYCENVKYVAKIDVDTLFNIPLLLSLLDKVPVQETSDAFVIGFRHAYKQPKAEHKGRWAIPESIYPYNFLPRYVYGHSYVLARSAVDRVVDNLPFFPIIPNEDAFITGIMSLVSNVTRVHSPAFAHLFRMQTYSDVVYSRFVSSIHNKKKLIDIWSHFLSRKSNENPLVPK